MRAALARLGFRQHGERPFITEPNGEFVGWLGLNRATRRGEGITALNPVVGVRHEGIEMLVAELRDKPFDHSSPPTIATPLGYLTPHRTYREWLLTGPETVDAVVADMVDAIGRYGVTFVEDNSDLTKLVARMTEGNYGFRQDTEYRLPLGLFLLGDIDGSREAIAEALTRRAHANRTADPFVGFARHLNEYMATHSHIEVASSRKTTVPVLAPRKSLP
jgi:hypothetical protein